VGCPRCVQQCGVCMCARLPTHTGPYHSEALSQQDTCVWGRGAEVSVFVGADVNVVVGVGVGLGVGMLVWVWVWV
jgi:hypothetical protein